METDAAKINETMEKNNMSRSSFASFHLTGIKPTTRSIMATSVDRLFSGETNGTAGVNNNHGEFDVSIYQFITQYKKVNHFISQSLPSIQECATQRLNDLHMSEKSIDKTSSCGRDSPGTATSTAKSSRRDSLSEIKQQQVEIASAKAHLPNEKIPVVPPSTTAENQNDAKT